MHDRKLENHDEETDELEEAHERNACDEIMQAFEQEQAHWTGKTIAIDFDGVLHSYRKPIDLDEQHLILDPPVEGAREWMVEVMRHFNVVVYTARHVSPGGLEAVKEWMKEWVFPNVPVTGTKPVARLYVDDRGYQFTGDNFPSIEYLLDFQPWNRSVNWDRE